MAFLGGKSGIRSNAEAGSGVLRAYVSEDTEAEATRLLALLFEDYLRPWCDDATRRIIRTYGLHGADQTEERAEVTAEVMLQMTARLREIRAGNAAEITNLRSYMVTVVYNSCFARIRARCPQHAQLQNRIRYLLRNDATFAVWTSGEGEQLTGLRAWLGAAAGAGVPVAAPVMQRSGQPLRELLKGMFEVSAAPVRLTDLIVAAADSIGIAEPAHGGFEDAEPAAQAPAADRVLMGQQSLLQLWEEVIQLPQSQRMALLLNLRDGSGHGVIELIPATGVATFGQLAAALDLSPLKLAGIWPDLPLDDAGIAGMLGITRQQVINLRKSARDRLARRRKTADGNKVADPASTTIKGRTMRTRIQELFRGQGRKTPGF
jgi:hypothetical protein